METDHVLLEAARKMNRDALTQIFDLYSSAIFRYAYRLCNDAVIADHVVGDVFGRLLDLFSAGNGPTHNLRSYLFAAAYHRILDEARYSRQRVSLEEVEVVPGDDLSAIRYLENQILFEPVVRALRYDLTDYQRHVIILRFFEGFSLRETAEILGKSVNVVKAAQHHAIVILRKKLGRQELMYDFSSAKMADSVRL